MAIPVAQAKLEEAITPSHPLSKRQWALTPCTSRLPEPRQGVIALPQVGWLVHWMLPHSMIIQRGVPLCFDTCTEAGVNVMLVVGTTSQWCDIMCDANTR